MFPFKPWAFPQLHVKTVPANPTFIFSSLKKQMLQIDFSSFSCVLWEFSWTCKQQHSGLCNLQSKKLKHRLPLTVSSDQHFNKNKSMQTQINPILQAK